MKMDIKEIELPTGVRLQYAEQGDPQGVPVIFLHGYTDSWRSFQSVLLHLPPSVHAFALSQRGHGDSDHPPEGYTPRDFAADAAAFMERLKIHSAILVGHSMGTAIAQRFVIDYPERALGLVLVGSVIKWRENPGLIEFWKVVSTLADPIDPEFVREFQESTLAQSVPGPFIDAVVQESRKVPARVWKEALKSLLDTDLSGEIGQITVPALIFWGAQEALATREEQDFLIKAIPGSRLMIYEKAGHALHWEEPGRFAADLQFFIESIVQEKGVHRIRK